MRGVGGLVEGEEAVHVSGSGWLVVFYGGLHASCGLRVMQHEEWLES